MPSQWKPVARVTDLDDDDVLQVSIGDKLVALYKLGGQFYATSDICTHEYACLSDGFVEDGKIECPLHQGLFDIATGKAQGAPVDVDLETFAVKVEGDSVLVAVDD